MRKLFLVLILITTMVQAQEVKQIPQISVSGEGKIKVTPDEATITVAVENTGKESAEVKKKNDEAVSTHHHQEERTRPAAAQWQF